MSRHTPGPWMVNKYGSVGAGAYGVQPIIAQIEPFYGPEEVYGSHAANAWLIAAAPELLAACKAAIAVIKGREHTGFLEAAIAKALGT